VRKVGEKNSESGVSNSSKSLDEKNFEKISEEIANKILFSEIKKSIKLELERAAKQVLTEQKNAGEELIAESFPLSIFSEKISSLEAIVKYFAEEKKYSYKKISKILNRNERTIWTTYQRAIKKIPGILDSSSEILIPAGVISERKLAVLESIVHFLRTEKKLSLHEISILLHRNERTIWTVDFRAKKKLLKDE
jgi:hypothetical protein